jgi:hypothetical protein
MYIQKEMTEISIKKLRKNALFGILKNTVKKSRIRIRNPVYGSKGPDSFPNVTDPEH